MSSNQPLHWVCGCGHVNYGGMCCSKCGAGGSGTRKTKRAGLARKPDGGKKRRK